MARSKRYTPERVARLVKNPGTRATVPTRYLPAKYRRMRERNARLDRPVVPGSGLTNREAARERNAQVSLRYGPVENELNQQFQRSQAIQQAIPGYYDQYRQLLNATNAGVAQGYAAAAQQFGQLQAGAGQQLANPAIAAQNQQIASLGGSANPQQQQIASQAAAQRAAMAGNLGGVLVAQGANQNAYGANLVGNTGAHQIESLLQELQNERDIRGDQAQLGREKGAFAQTTDQAIRDRERKAILENQAFGLDVANTAADNERADAQLEETRRQHRRQQRNADEKVNKYGIPEKQWRRWSTSHRQRVIDRYERKHGSGDSGGGSATPSQRQSANSQIQRALTYAKAAKRKGTPRSKIARALVAGQPSRSKVDEKEYQRLVDKGVSPVDARRRATRRSTAIPKIDQFWASVALDMAYDGHLSRKNQKKLHSLGYSVRDLGLTSFGDYSRRMAYEPHSPATERR